ncbi:3-dehydroquinate synthase [Peptoniphilus obesi]|uniref:3-dehydroquinate synthase n=1 Tax=Peptoniphilus obesi TaxID=1472765 RepID=UPI0004AF0FED|nr:3-dehydroquinate synthase [Peptoniphilus obesi]
MLIEVKENNYNIEIDEGIDKKLINYLSKDEKKKIAIITDANIYSIYKKRINRIFRDLDYYVFVIRAGEGSKSFDFYTRILNYLCENNFTRSDTILAFGGGVTGDLAGFVASTYLRGIEYVCVPTTLLAMVDSSVGGKNGINFFNLKNQVGTFYFPSYVHVDHSFVKTLDKRNINNGLAEMFKYAILDDRDLFDELCKDFSEIDLEKVIERSLRIKLKYVSGDERDMDKRQYLNLGHTIGHAIEALSKYSVKHGEAIALGIVFMAKAAYRMKLTEDDFYNEIIDAFEKHGLMTEYDFNLDYAMEIIEHDKKVKNGMINMIIPTSIGSAINKEVNLESLKHFIEIGME